MKVSVQLVTWNGEKYLTNLLESLQAQTFNDFELLVWDNGSKDGTVDIIKKYTDEFFVDTLIVQRLENSGFAPAHTELFQKSNSEYVFVLNQDVVLENNVLEKLVEYLDKNPSLGSVAPRLLRLENDRKTNIVDSLGLEVKKNRKAVDIGSGEDYQTFNDELSPVRPVFGVSGAVAMYRRKAVQAVSREKELFDVSYVSYQEDYDLAWRLQLGGFSSAVILGATAYHHRGARESDKKKRLGIVENKINQPFFIRYNSYRNHLITLYKNEQWQNFSLDFIFIFWYECVKLVYNFLFDRAVLVGLREIYERRAELVKERKRLKSITKRPWQEIGKWLA